jgi:phospholipid/cholesterol/gamma-HCH transport system substrate-binding protein
MRNNSVETLIAAAVIAVGAAFLFYAWRTTSTGRLGAYALEASLNSVDGLADGADIRLHGIKIGTVSAIEMDRKTYKPLLHLSIRDDIRLPVDSRARVASLLANGNPYLSVEPGHSPHMLDSTTKWKAN